MQLLEESSRRGGAGGRFVDSFAEFKQLKGNPFDVLFGRLPSKGVICEVTPPARMDRIAAIGGE